MRTFENRSVSGAIDIADGAARVQNFGNRMFQVNDYWKLQNIQFHTEIQI